MAATIDRMTVAGQLRIGTSGWIYRHWQGAFYPPSLPQSSWFSTYSDQFDSVEINATFYRLPLRRTVERWRAEAPSGFAYAVKGSRFITHNKKLADPEESLERFFSVMDHLGSSMAVVLWQLPPSWGFDPDRLEKFLRAFRARERKRRLCFEFRNPRWFDDEALDILHKWNAGFCIHDLGGRLTPIEITADFAYVRLHGIAGAYAGQYGEAGLEPWATRIRGWLDAGIDCFAYFNNDYAAAAPRDAATLSRLLTTKRSHAPAHALHGG